jgi:hypothetical protein
MGDRKWGTQPRENFFIPNSLWRISLIVGTVVRKCCAIALALSNVYLCINASSCGPRVERGHPECGESLQDKSPFLNF